MPNGPNISTSDISKYANGSNNNDQTTIAAITGFGSYGYLSLEGSNSTQDGFSSKIVIYTIQHNKVPNIIPRDAGPSKPEISANYRQFPKRKPSKRSSVRPSTDDGSPDNSVNNDIDSTNDRSHEDDLNQKPSAAVTQDHSAVTNSSNSNITGLTTSTEQLKEVMSEVFHESSLVKENRLYGRYLHTLGRLVQITFANANIPQGKNSSWLTGEVKEANDEFTKLHGELGALLERPLHYTTPAPPPKPLQALTRSYYEQTTTTSSSDVEDQSNSNPALERLEEATSSLLADDRAVGVPKAKPNAPDLDDKSDPAKEPSSPLANNTPGPQSASQDEAKPTDKPAERLPSPPPSRKPSRQLKSATKMPVTETTKRGGEDSLATVLAD